MTSNALLEAVNQIQIDYLEVLKLLKANRNSDIIPLANEILTFWFRKRKIIVFFLESLSKAERHYIYTGAAYLNVNQKEHFPFLLLPGNHIWDDPLPSYISSFKDLKTGELRKEIRPVFCKLVANNINIISSLHKLIHVLPVRFIFELDNLQTIKDTGDRLFLDLFKPELKITDIETYFSTFKSISDIEKGIRTSLKEHILPSNSRGTFEQKFDNNKDRIPEFSSQLDDVANFYSIVFGGLSQAMSILLVCATYNLKPYVHFYPAIHYLLWLYPIIAKTLRIEDIVFWAFVGFSISRNFNSSRFVSFSTKKFIDYLSDKQFATGLTYKLRKEKLNPGDLKTARIAKAVCEVLESVYPITPYT